MFDIFHSNIVFSFLGQLFHADLFHQISLNYFADYLLILNHTQIFLMEDYLMKNCLFHYRLVIAALDSQSSSKLCFVFIFDTLANQLYLSYFDSISWFEFCFYMNLSVLTHIYFDFVFLDYMMIFHIMVLEDGNMDFQRTTFRVFQIDFHIHYFLFHIMIIFFQDIWGLLYNYYQPDSYPSFYGLIVQ